LATVEEELVAEESWEELIAEESCRDLYTVEED
jgi:hypothetical protein